MTKADPITQALAKAIADQVFPGAAIVVRHHGQIQYHQAVGRLTYHPSSQRVKLETIYDLASLTKPLATVTAIACLVRDGLMNLDQKVGEWLEDFQDCSIGTIPIRSLLQHQSGLPGWKPYYQIVAPSGVSPRDDMECLARKTAMMAAIAREPLSQDARQKGCYSDLGFILLGFIIERIVGQSLASYCREKVYDPLGVGPLWFVDWNGKPVGRFTESEDVAPTEEDSWRGRLIHKEVHDENAFVLGGIAGHAGLFGTALAVSAMSELWLGSLKRRTSFLSAQMVNEFVTCPDPVKSSWALGWDTPSYPSSSGSYFSADSFGHLGYTGTSLWADPVCDFQVVVISNRVHPTRRNTKIQAFRPFLHDLVYREFVG